MDNDKGVWIGVGLLIIALIVGLVGGIVFTRDMAGRAVANAKAKARVAVAERDKAEKETLFWRWYLRQLVQGDTAQGMVQGRVSEGD